MVRFVMMLITYNYTGRRHLWTLKSPHPFLFLPAYLIITSHLCKCAPLFNVSFDISYNDTSLNLHLDQLTLNGTQDEAVSNNIPPKSSHQLVLNSSYDEYSVYIRDSQESTGVNSKDIVNNPKKAMEISSLEHSVGNDRVASAEIMHPDDAKDGFFGANYLYTNGSDTSLDDTTAYLKEFEPLYRYGTASDSDNGNLGRNEMQVKSSQPKIKANPSSSDKADTRSDKTAHNIHPDEPGIDVIRIPKGVVIDAMFDSIDSLQDLLDVCEEGIRQRLVIHRDDFFGNSPKLKETTNDDDLDSDRGLDDMDLDLDLEVDYDIIISTGSKGDASSSKLKYDSAIVETNNLQGDSGIPSSILMRRLLSNVPNTAEEDWGDLASDESELGDPGKSNRNRQEMGNRSRRDITFAWSEENISRSSHSDEGRIKDGDLMTRKVSREIATDQTDFQIQDTLAGGHIDDKNIPLDETTKYDHVTTTDQSHYFAVAARNVIKRLSRRIRYLERTIEECQTLTRDMTHHEIHP